jgi:hypothetical protein
VCAHDFWQFAELDQWTMTWVDCESSRSHSRKLTCDLVRVAKTNQYSGGSGGWGGNFAISSNHSNMKKGPHHFVTWFRRRSNPVPIFSRAECQAG